MELFCRFVQLLFCNVKLMSCYVHESNLYDVTLKKECSCRVHFYFVVSSFYFVESSYYVVHSEGNFELFRDGLKLSVIENYQLLPAGEM